MDIKSGGEVFMKDITKASDVASIPLSRHSNHTSLDDNIGTTCSSCSFRDI